MSTSITTQKEKRWQDIVQAVSCMQDKLGKPIDAGIRETVVTLNALAISTTASCEGHLDWGTGAPWVDIASTHPTTHVALTQLSTEALKERERGQKTAAELAVMFDEIHRLRREVKAVHLQERQKLLQYLAAFYEDRHVPFDQRLIIRPIGTDGKSRLESQGADCQEVAPPDTLIQKLQEYQEEMRTFTAYLKQIYLEA
jgi:hypothetical protein